MIGRGRGAKIIRGKKTRDRGRTNGFPRSIVSVSWKRGERNRYKKNIRNEQCTSASPPGINVRLGRENMRTTPMCTAQRAYEGVQADFCHVKGRYFANGFVIFARFVRQICRLRLTLVAFCGRISTRRIIKINDRFFCKGNRIKYLLSNKRSIRN